MITPKNVWNMPVLDDWLEALAANYEDPAIQKWIKTVGKRHLLTDASCFRQLSMKDVSKLYIQHPWLLKAIPRGTTVWEFDQHDNDLHRFREDAEHAVIHLAFKKATGTKDLNTVDWDTAVHEGGRALERERITGLTQETEVDKVLVHRYNNGYAWWSLKSAKAMRNESAHMGHCVGNENMSYIRRVAAGELEILSLRDAKNEPHVTIEYIPSTGRLAQLKGKANQGINEKYKSACVGFLKGMIAEGKLRWVYTGDLERSHITASDLGVIITDFGDVQAR